MRNVRTSVGSVKQRHMIYHSDSSAKSNTLVSQRILQLLYVYMTRDSIYVPIMYSIYVMCKVWIQTTHCTKCGSVLCARIAHTNLRFSHAITVVCKVHIQIIYDYSSWTMYTDAEISITDQLTSWHWLCVQQACIIDTRIFLKSELAVQARRLQALYSYLVYLYMVA